ncbi:alkylresorcinol/alkylpyrone synthase [Parasphingorhabdus marina DSM 22363]|uniref:Alkylresorcinol/alkylpyrone synthase n=1 Tax=Parasphingorhabdus marina DSM 22363 TaxID=1123272 RepID=A0A1N6D713_9SPHN|nr:type III polyketide synthase [Parasphingorhabdus marina]SIN66507.1 alkylresorcinol/alkylpyrone synthase [Parasphingorhabdus marina DSM 22363]
MPGLKHPRLQSIATAVPDHRISQAEVLAILARARGAALPARLEQILGNSGIDQRYLACEPDYYLEQRSWPDRAACYDRVGRTLAEQVAAEAMDRARMTPADIDAIVMISTTGTMTPSIPSRMIETMGFPSSTRTVPVFGYGCAGGVLGLRLASDLANGGEGQNILLVSLELCSLSYDYSQFDKKNMIATALFADGCAAAVISGRPDCKPGPAFRGFEQKTWPDTRDMMGWEIGQTGFDLVLARDIPTFVARDFAPFCDRFLEEQGLAMADLSEPACHPGGGRVVDALENYFAPEIAAITATRSVLERYGNMSSPTVLFVLEHLLRGKPDRPVLLTALGPGFTSALAILDPRED